MERKYKVVALPNALMSESGEKLTLEEVRKNLDDFLGTVEANGEILHTLLQVEYQERKNFNRMGVNRGLVAIVERITGESEDL